MPDSRRTVWRRERNSDQGVARPGASVFRDYPEEIDQLLEENSQPIAELRELYPFIHTAATRLGIGH
jgi:hypothetical protein